MIMVVSIRELVNIQISTSAFNLKSFQIARIPADTTIDINNDFIRGRMNSPSNASLRSALVTSNAFSVPYHKRIETNNDLPDKKVRNPIDSFQLSYKDKNKADNSVRKATNKDSTRNQQHVQNKALALKNT